jgi:hypothetical protein
LFGLIRRTEKPAASKARTEFHSIGASTFDGIAD